MYSLKINIPALDIPSLEDRLCASNCAKKWGYRNQSSPGSPEATLCCAACAGLCSDTLVTHVTHRLLESRNCLLHVTRHSHSRKGAGVLVSASAMIAEDTEPNMAEGPLEVSNL